MFLVEPDPTALDLNWRMFGVPVRVHPLFWLITLVLGWGNAGGQADLLLIWVACVFVSLLNHELGHVFAGLAFGRRGHIVLHSFGGLAVGSSDLASRWQRIMVYAAGPLIQLALYGILWLLAAHFIQGLEPNPRLGLAFDYLLAINWYWPILNLLPIWPLDGGQISRDVFLGVVPGRGLTWSLGVSLLTAGGLAAYFWWRGQTYNAILFGFLGLGSFQTLQQLRSAGPWIQERRSSWERDPDDWKR